MVGDAVAAVIIMDGHADAAIIMDGREAVIAAGKRD